MFLGTMRRVRKVHDLLRLNVSCRHPSPFCNRMLPTVARYLQPTRCLSPSAFNATFGVRSISRLFTVEFSCFAWFWAFSQTLRPGQVTKEHLPNNERLRLDWRAGIAFQLVFCISSFRMLRVFRSQSHFLNFGSSGSRISRQCVALWLN